MKTIGLIGGMSWESTSEYYRIINEEVKSRLGKLHSAKIVMWSFDFQEIEELQHSGDWEKLSQKMIEAGGNLKKAGADFIVICTNTMHKMADEIEKATGLEVYHIADATANEIKSKNMKKVALLGTEFTMTGDFYKKRIEDKFDIEIIIPNEIERKIIHKIIYEELCLGIVEKDSKQIYLEIIKKMEEKGAEGIILGCTEIPLLIKNEDCDIELFDTTYIHSLGAVEKAVGKSNE